MFADKSGKETGIFSEIIGLEITYLPPIGIILFNNLQYITILEGKASISTWDHAVFFRVIVKMSTNKYLDGKQIVPTCW